MVLEQVRTRLGQGMVAGHVISGPGLLVADEPHVLTKDEIQSPMPRGMHYLINRELASRTENKVTHMIVKGGLYAADRLLNHVKDGSWMEINEIREKKHEIVRCAEDLLASGSMDAEVVQMVLDILQVLENDFAEPKRAPLKLVASRRLGQARKLRALPDRRKIAPAAMVAYAANHHLSHRIEDVWMINRFFHQRSFRVYLLLEEHRETVNRLGPFVHSELRELITLLANPHKHRNAQVILRQRLRILGPRVELMKEQPFCLLAERIMKLFACLDAQSEKVHQLAMLGNQEELSRLVTQMELMDELETRVIPVMAFYLARVRPKQRLPEDLHRANFRERLEAAHKQAFESAITAPLRELLIKHLDLCRQAEQQDKLQSALRFLKQATLLLSAVL